MSIEETTEDDFKARVGLFTDGVRKLCAEHGIDMQAVIGKFGAVIEFVNVREEAPKEEEVCATTAE